jgi:hypothetical protein
MLVVAITVFVVEAVHGHFVGLPADDTGHHLLATPDDALHRGAGSQLHEAADNVLKEGTWTHGAKKSPAGVCWRGFILFKTGSKNALSYSGPLPELPLVQ